MGMDKTRKLKDLLNMKEIREMLDRINRPIAFRRVLADLTGSVQGALMLSQAIYWQERATQRDGWWYKTGEDWEKETGLSIRAQKTARRKASKYLASKLKGLPATLYYRVNRQALAADLTGLLRGSADGEDGRKSITDGPASNSDTIDSRLKMMLTETAVKAGAAPQTAADVQNPTPSSSVRVDRAGQNGQTDATKKGALIVQNGQPISDGKAAPVLRFHSYINRYSKITPENKEEEETQTPAQEAAEINPDRNFKEPKPPSLQQVVQDYRLLVPEADPNVVEKFVNKTADLFSPEEIRDALMYAIKGHRRSLKGVIEVLETWGRTGQE
jgi:hypothetical protein